MNFKPIIYTGPNDLDRGNPVAASLIGIILVFLGLASNSSILISGDLGRIFFITGIPLILFSLAFMEEPLGSKSKSREIKPTMA